MVLDPEFQEEPAAVRTRGRQPAGGLAPPPLHANDPGLPQNGDVAGHAGHRKPQSVSQLADRRF